MHALFAAPSVHRGRAAFSALGTQLVDGTRLTSIAEGHAFDRLNQNSSFRLSHFTWSSHTAWQQQGRNVSARAALVSAHRPCATMCSACPLTPEPMLLARHHVRGCSSG